MLVQKATHSMAKTSAADLMKGALKASVYVLHLGTTDTTVDLSKGSMAAIK